MQRGKKAQDLQSHSLKKNSLEDRRGSRSKTKRSGPLLRDFPIG